MKSPILILIFTIFSIAMKSVADTGCSHQARTPLEELFCQIQLTSVGSGLPSFSDFRRNQPKIQALLLKRPARKLGLEVPTSTVVPRVAKNSKKEAKHAAALSEPIKPISVSLRGSLGFEKPVARITANPFLQCQFRGKRIACKNRHYELVDNKHNRRLAKDVLSANNLLGMMRFSGSVENEVELNSYLAESYTLYIQKMIDIGLGGVTMSYTKFYYTFMELVDTKENFAERFEIMYSFLKKDKATMLIEGRFDDQMPSGLQDCMDLNETLIVCDNLTMNWIYQLQ